MTARVKDRAAMIRQMAPDLQPGAYSFATLPPGQTMADLPPDAVAACREAKGISVIRPCSPETPLAMAWITLRVASALDGVGLTAAVAGALAAEHIPCNVVAGHHHDHLFVPLALADRSMGVLRTLAEGGKDI